MKQKPGEFIISLDLELGWGFSGWKRAGAYEKNILGTRAMIPKLLDLFAVYEIHATWAAVGFLFFSDRESLLNGLPGSRPGYDQAELSSYNFLPQLGRDEMEDPLHFGAGLLRTIGSYPYQEIGSHTFSHYYCLARGQDRENFRADLVAAKEAGRGLGMEVESIVFPRHQCNPSYLPLCRQEGMTSYRGINEGAWMYRSRRRRTLISRLGRGIDYYLPLSGCNAYRISFPPSGEPVNLRESRFLKPCRMEGSLLEGLRLRRILRDLYCAAAKGLSYHLWWHPHNFGAAPEINLAFLKRILEYYHYLRDHYGMVSRNMKEAARPWI